MIRGESGEHSGSGRLVRPQSDKIEKGGHISLLMVKRLLGPGRLGRNGSASG
jgi:hypothetical protein